MSNLYPTETVEEMQMLILITRHTIRTIHHLPTIKENQKQLEHMKSALQRKVHARDALHAHIISQRSTAHVHQSETL